MVPTRLPTRNSVLAARRRISRRIHLTPVHFSPSLDVMAGVSLLVKCENLQRSGSFKFRGALNAVLSLTPEQRRQGVVTHSSGNHGSALAAVAQALGIPATVVVPRSASAFKRAAIKRYGAQVVPCGATLRAREKMLSKVQAASGANFIPPYDHARIIAGQGTAALELLEQAPEIDEIWVPVGGGGLAAGTVLAAGDSVQVVGAEPELARDAYDSLRLGERQEPLAPLSVADGLRTALGELNFRVLKDYQLPIHLVSEADILAAQQLAMSCLKQLIEPSSAVPLAALLKHGPQHTGSRRVAVIISGGNIAL